MKKKIVVCMLGTVLALSLGTACGNTNVFDTEIVGNTQQTEVATETKSEIESEEIRESESQIIIETEAIGETEIVESELFESEESEIETEEVNKNETEKVETEISEREVIKNESELEEQIQYTYKEMNTIMYVKDSVNVRDLPSTNGNKLGGLSQGQEVTVIGQCNETSWYKIEFNESIAYVSNNYLLQEKVVKDEFIENTYNFYSPEETIYYDSPNVNGNIISTKPSYSLLIFSAYNPQTGWYRVLTGDANGRYMAYVQHNENFMTREEYNAMLNEGVSEDYSSLGCVKNPADYRYNGITTIENYDTGKACVYINGEHNFVSIEMAEKCGKRRFEAENEFKDMYFLYGVDNHDGTITHYCSTSFYMQTYDAKVFYEKYPETTVFDTHTEYSRLMDEYVLEEVLKVLHSK